MKSRVIGRLKGKEVLGLDFASCEVKQLADDELLMIGSTDTEDRDGEVIDPKAWDLKNYKKNPVILPAHDYRQPAIGRADEVKIKDGKLTFKIKFPPEGDNPVADVYRKLYKGGFMSASSVGFFPKQWVDGDGKKNPWRTWTEVELLELSLVSVPANPEALAEQRGIKEAVKKGVLTGEDVKTLQAYAKSAMEGGKDGNDVEEIPLVEEATEAGQDGDGGEKQSDIEARRDEEVKGLKDSLEALKNENKELKIKVEVLETQLGEFKGRFEGLEARLSELKASKQHYLDVNLDDKKVVDVKEISGLASEIFK